MIGVISALAVGIVIGYLAGLNGRPRSPRCSACGLPDRPGGHPECAERARAELVQRREEACGETLSDVDAMLYKVNPWYKNLWFALWRKLNR